MRNRNLQAARPRRLESRARSRSRKGPLTGFARDLAARIQEKLRERPRGGANRSGIAHVQSAGTSSARGSLPGIAIRLLGMKLAHPIEAIEIALLSQAMSTTSGNITAAARLLGIHRKAVERLLTKHKLQRRSSSRRARAA